MRDDIHIRIARPSNARATICAAQFREHSGQRVRHAAAAVRDPSDTDSDRGRWCRHARARLPGYDGHMEGHRTAERRSLAYHRAIAARLHQPDVLDRARERVRRWQTSHEVSAYYASAWSALLDKPLPELAGVLGDESEHMTALRQVSPFAGVLDPRTRWEIWRSVA